MKISKTLPFLIMALSLVLSACGGGSSGGSPAADTSNGGSPAAETGSNAADTDAAPVTMSFKQVTYDLLNAGEDTEPMDMTAVDMDADADDDETAFSGLFSSITN